MYVESLKEQREIDQKRKPNNKEQYNPAEIEQRHNSLGRKYKVSKPS